MILTDSVENRMMKVLAISNMVKINSKGEEGGGGIEREFQWCLNIVIWTKGIKRRGIESWILPSFSHTHRWIRHHMENQPLSSMFYLLNLITWLCPKNIMDIMILIVNFTPMDNFKSTHFECYFQNFTDSSVSQLWSDLSLSRCDYQSYSKLLP